MKYEPLQSYEVNPMFLDDVTGNITAKIKAEVRDLSDKAIVDAAVRAAQKEGITTLYLLDRRFIMDAIREKIAREQKGR